MKVGILSDTHSYIDERICSYLCNCNEIWHAGDIGDIAVADQLQALGIPLRAVYGNIDNHEVRITYPEIQYFNCAGVQVLMVHIGGYPPNYNKKTTALLQQYPADVFICGHSHLLKVIPDPKRKMLHINPGAAGQHGFHKMRTLIILEIKEGKPHQLQVVELGKRGK